MAQNCVIEDAKPDDMFIAQGDDESGCRLKSTYLYNSLANTLDSVIRALI
jgi:hypothetical protein